MIAFCDIDGCLVPFGGPNPYNLRAFSPDAIAAVRTLKDAGYRLILHSTWRHCHDDRALAEHLFFAAGIPLDGCVDHDEPSKAAVIVDWLREHYADDWPAVVVIDDDEVIVPGARLVRVDFRRGLVVGDLEVR